MGKIINDELWERIQSSAEHYSTNMRYGLKGAIEKYALGKKTREEAIVCINEEFEIALDEMDAFNLLAAIFQTKKKPEADDFADLQNEEQFILFDLKEVFYKKSDPSRKVSAFQGSGFPVVFMKVELQKGFNALIISHRQCLIKAKPKDGSTPSMLTPHWAYIEDNALVIKLAD